jgi:hypothetical protein
MNILWSSLGEGDTFLCNLALFYWGLLLTYSLDRAYRDCKKQWVCLISTINSLIPSVCLTFILHSYYLRRYDLAAFPLAFITTSIWFGPTTMHCGGCQNRKAMFRLQEPSYPSIYIYLRRLPSITATSCWYHLENANPGTR